jgi:putative copper export protein
VQSKKEDLMTLMFGTLAAIVLGLAFGWRVWTAAALGLVWYICLAVQTAYLAHPGRTGLFHVNALRAVQGSSFGQYWVSQPVILAVFAVLMRSLSRMRSRWLGPRSVRPSPSQHLPSTDVSP